MGAGRSRGSNNSAVLDAYFRGGYEALERRNQDV